MEHRNKHNIRVKDKRTLYSLIFTTNTIDIKIIIYHFRFRINLYSNLFCDAYTLEG
jgi:hypothetical protein